MSAENNSNLGGILAGIAAIITASGGIYALWDKEPKTSDIPEPKIEETIDSKNEQKENLASLSSAPIIADGFWKSQTSDKIREIRLTEKGLKLKSGGDWYLYDRVSTNLYRRETLDGGQITLIVVDKNTVKQITSKGGERIWVRSKAE